ncbi:MAG: amino acid transporter ATPase [Acidimicrobiales bacterium]|nr:amino acid transporter ATPase [Acidimicrobiales bacterium]
MSPSVVTTESSHDVITDGNDSAAALLTVDAIDVHYGPIQALRAVSLTIGSGERVALVGANGAGKTTTLRAISGLLAPTRGRITFDGEPIGGMAANKVVQRGIAHLPEGRELFFGLSVEENLRAGFWSQRRAGRAYKSQRDQVMDHFPILRERAHQAAGTLSGGEQQMLGVARALMSNPRLLIVDELSLGLAPKIVSQLFDILAEINRAGTAVLIVEQFVHMALANTDRAAVLAKGEVVLAGPSRDLLADPQLIATYLGEQAPKPDEPPRRPSRRAPKRTSNRT